MRFARTIFVTLTLFGCSNDSAQRLPTAPGPPVPTAPTASALTSLWGMVVNESGVCIVGATVRVVTPDVEMTLRASASGYAAQEKTMVPNGAQTAVLFVPSRIR
jgi:hypothetical protein